MRDLISYNLNHETYKICYISISYTKEVDSRFKGKILILSTRGIKLFLEEDSVSVAGWHHEF